MISSNNLWKGIGLAVGTQVGYSLALTCYPERNDAGEIVTHPAVYGARLFVAMIPTLHASKVFASHFSSEGQGTLVELAQGVALIALTYFALNVCIPLIASLIPSYEVTVYASALGYLGYLLYDYLHKDEILKIN